MKHLSNRLHLSILFIFSIIHHVLGFSTHHHSFCPQRTTLATQHRLEIVKERKRRYETKLWFWGRNNKEEKEEKKDKEEEKKNDETEDDRSIPFYARFLEANKPKKSEEETKETVVAAVEAAVEAPVEAPLATTTKEKKEEEKVDRNDPVAAAKALKRQAEKARLEAEKMEAMLTLDKIANLEKQLNSPSVLKNPDSAKDVRNQIAILTKKLQEGDEPKKQPPKQPSIVEPKEVTTMPTATDTTSEDAEIPSLSAEELENRTQAFLETPKFLRLITAKAAGFEDDSNATAVVEKMYEDEQAYEMAVKRMESSVDKKSLSEKELREKTEEYEKLPKFLRDMTAKAMGFEDGDNATQIVLTMWEREQLERESEQIAQKLTDSTGEKQQQSWGLFGDAKLKTETEIAVEGCFSKSTRKEGQTPTEAQVYNLISDVISKTSFVVSGKPEVVPGGYIIRGTNREETGAEFIQTIDKFLSKSAVKDKLSVFFVSDPTPITDEQMETLERPPVLFISGPDVSPDSNRLLLYLTTGLGIVTTSFFSVYPFALNDDIANRVQEQITLTSGTGAEPDLQFLTDLTTPIFLSFIVLQIAHELAHYFVARANDFKISPPTFVPSPFLGITGTITSVKSPPKDKQALIDFAIAGPLTGMLLSILLIFLGLQITLGLDAASFQELPTLPVAFLYQSSLGAAMVESIFGAGTLSVPDPLTSTIHLHPLTISGYASLIVNAMQLLPFGRSDGGRVSLALFGRTGKQVVDFVTSISLFFIGLFSSDALLLYFAFLLFFQSEPEIPCRNEVDDVDFSRVIGATLVGILVLLSVIPV